VKDGFLSNWYKNWKSDTEYGRQTLNGINPLMIERVTEELPEKFKVTNEHLDGLLQRGLSLAQEIAAGNMFLIDYEILDGINTGTYNGKKLHLPVPFCLFYLRPNDDLVPIAIQLTQGI
jgi:arachidonate 5-lipoxygenase